MGSDVIKTDKKKMLNLIRKYPVVYGLIVSDSLNHPFNIGTGSRINLLTIGAVITLMV